MQQRVDNPVLPVEDDQTLVDVSNKLEAQHLLHTNDHTTWNLVTGISITTHSELGTSASMMTRQRV
jgi:hypothetical protein